MERKVTLIAEPGDRVEVRGASGFWSSGVRAGVLLYADVRFYEGQLCRVLYKVDFDDGTGNPDAVYTADRVRRVVRLPQEPDPKQS